MFDRKILDEYVENHRKMWNWISDFLMYYKPPSDDGGFLCIYDLKKEYIKRYQEKDINIDNLCYLCEYKNKLNMSNMIDTPLSCSDCILDWGESVFNCMSPNSLYFEFSKALMKKRYSDCAKIAEQIANLPERKVDIDGCRVD